jgi:putative oxidoreductase
MKTKMIILVLLVTVLVVLYIYTPATKIMKFEDFKLAIGAQPLVPALKTCLIYTLPTVQVLVLILLIISKYRKLGLYASLFLLLVFTGYIILIKLNYYGTVPCSCAGVLGYLDWTQHLYFNGVFILVNIAALFLHRHIHHKEFHPPSIPQ